MTELPQRKPNRLSGYDYSQNGAYFVTICIQNRHELLGHVVGATVPGRPRSPDHPRPTIPQMPPIHPRLTIPQTSHIRPYVELSELGQITDDAIKHNNRDGAHIDCYVIMPNHIHIIFVLSSPPDERGIADGRGGAGDRGRSPLQMVVRNMKAYITKQIGFSPWQKSFHDHIIRNEYEYARIAEYIENNPANWENDCFYAAPPDSHTP